MIFLANSLDCHTIPQFTLFSLTEEIKTKNFMFQAPQRLIHTFTAPSKPNPAYILSAGAHAILASLNRSCLPGTN